MLCHAQSVSLFLGISLQRVFSFAYAFHLAFMLTKLCHTNIFCMCLLIKVKSAVFWSVKAGKWHFYNVMFVNVKLNMSRLIINRLKWTCIGQNLCSLDLPDVFEVFSTKFTNMYFFELKLDLFELSRSGIIPTTHVRLLSFNLFFSPCLLSLYILCMLPRNCQITWNLWREGRGRGGVFFERVVQVVGEKYYPDFVNL